MDRLRRFMEGIAPILAWITFSVIYDGRTVSEYTIVSSLTATEVTQLIVDKVDKVLGPYLAAVACVAGLPKCSELEDKVREFRRRIALRKCVGSENEEACIEEIMNMDLDRLLSMARSSELIDVVPSLLFVGPPGVGKSEAVKEAARRIAEKYGFEFVDLAELSRIGLKTVMSPQSRRRYFVFVDLRLTSVEPADLMGIPRKVEISGTEVSEYVPFSWVEILASGPGMLFLDELTNVRREDVLAAAYQLVLDRKSGFRKFDPGVVIVSAGNPPSWSSIARKLPTPLHTRLEVFNVVKPTIYEWYLYMVRKYRDEWCKVIYSFIMVLGDENWCPSAHGKATILGPSEQIPTPRSWTRLAVQLYQMFVDEARERGTTPDNIVRRALMMAGVSGGCKVVKELLPGSERYEKLRTSKIVCEIVAANIGDDMAQEMSMYMIVPPIPVKLVIENPSMLPKLVTLDCLATAYVLGMDIPSSELREIEKVFGKLERAPNVPEHLKKLAEHMKNVDAVAVRYVLRNLMIDLSDIIEEWCMKGKEYLKSKIDTIAQIVSEVLKILEEKTGGIEAQDIVLLATMLLPICKRGWIDVKMELVKKCPKLMELVNKIAEAIASV